MRLATTLRRRHDTLPGITGVVRLDRRTPRLAARLHRGDIAVIDHVDIDRVTAEALVLARPKAVINAQPCISGRYPNLGPQVLVAHDVLLLDNVGPEIFGALKEGTKIRIDGDTVYLGEDPIVSGTRQDVDTVEALMLEAKSGLASQLEAFALDTGEFMMRERALLLDGVGIPEIRTPLTRRHAVVVVRGQGHAEQLKSLKHYIREYKPVLIGVDGGADALIEARLKPKLIVGDMDAVSDAALGSGAEVVAHALPDGRAPGLARVQDLGIDPVVFATSGTSEDAAMLLAHEHGAEVVVSVGSHGDLAEFLDRGRDGMASAFLTRLRLGSTLVDAKSVGRIYRTRISGAALLLLVIAAMVAVIVALAVSDTGRTYLGGLGNDWDHFYNWLQDRFS